MPRRRGMEGDQDGCHRRDWSAPLTKFVENEGGKDQTRCQRGQPDREDSGEVREDRPPEGSARETATGRPSGVSVVRSRKKEREAPESSVKVREAEADAYLRAQTHQHLRAQKHWHLEQQPHQHLEQQYQCLGRAAKAALGGVGTPTLLTRRVAGAKDVGARTKTPTTLTLRVPLTELLRGGGCSENAAAAAVAGADHHRSRSAVKRHPDQLHLLHHRLLHLRHHRCLRSHRYRHRRLRLHRCRRHLHPRHHSHRHPPTPSAASTATPTTPDSSTRALAPLALARAASPARGRRRTGRLKTNEVGRSGKGYRGRKGGREHPSKMGVRGSPREAPKATMLFAAARRPSLGGQQ
ncbi:unnamed protein product [Closterium sp. NIES-64]|nr:unnamed protein product [Closterium sp. NIES-64]